LEVKQRRRLLTHGGVILDHPKIATVSTRIATVVEDILIPVALTKTVPEADNAKLAYGHTHATTGGQNRRNAWALDSQENTSAPQETIASTIAKKTTLRKRGMLA